MKQPASGTPEQRPHNESRQASAGAEGGGRRRRLPCSARRLTLCALLLAAGETTFAAQLGVGLGLRAAGLDMENYITEERFIYPHLGLYAGLYSSLATFEFLYGAIFDPYTVYYPKYGYAWNLWAGGGGWYLFDLFRTRLECDLRGADGDYTVLPYDFKWPSTHRTLAFRPTLTLSLETDYFEILFHAALPVKADLAASTTGADIELGGGLLLADEFSFIVYPVLHFSGADPGVFPDKWAHLLDANLTYSAQEPRAIAGFGGSLTWTPQQGDDFSLAAALPFRVHFAHDDIILTPTLDLSFGKSLTLKLFGQFSHPSRSAPVSNFGIDFRYVHYFDLS